MRAQVRERVQDVLELLDLDAERPGDLRQPVLRQVVEVLLEQRPLELVVRVGRIELEQEALGDVPGADALRLERLDPLQDLLGLREREAVRERREDVLERAGQVAVVVEVEDDLLRERRVPFRVRAASGTARAPTPGASGPTRRCCSSPRSCSGRGRRPRRRGAPRAERLVPSGRVVGSRRRPAETRGSVVRGARFRWERVSVFGTSSRNSFVSSSASMTSMRSIAGSWSSSIDWMICGASLSERSRRWLSRRSRLTAIAPPASRLRGRPPVLERLGEHLGAGEVDRAARREARARGASRRPRPSASIRSSSSAVASPSASGFVARITSRTFPLWTRATRPAAEMCSGPLPS